jgi:murein DD-endopeptidase MepM/ murein hydrolase activator NlpD
MRHPERGPTFVERIGPVLDRLFPERQLHIRTHGRVSFFRLSQRLQTACAAAVFLALAWTAFSSINYLRHQAVLADKDSQIGESKSAYQGLLGEVADYQKKFTNLTRDMEDSHALMLGLVEKNASLQQNLTSVAKQLTVTRTEREEVASARERLKEKLGEIEDNMRKMANKNFSLTDNLNMVETDLQKALAERNQALFDGTRLNRRVKELETRMSELQEMEELTVQRLTESTVNYIDTMERVVAMAGLDVNALVKGVGQRAKGQGGPFIAAKSDDLPAKQLRTGLLKLDTHLTRFEALQDVMQRVPLATPLTSYYITSSFGKRRDPINNRWAAHYGIDLGSTLKSSVYATAPGVVTFSGWHGNYGKLVEIDHGAGLKTRYGHLNNILVKKGEKVDFHKVIGLLGSTGRSTGAHLHYEVSFKGKAKNPMNFIKAGRYVFQEQ